MTPKRPLTCAACGVSTPHIDRMCDACLAAKVRAARAEQGLPAAIEDPEALRLLARVFVGRRAAA